MFCAGCSLGCFVSMELLSFSFAHSIVLVSISTRSPLSSFSTGNGLFILITQSYLYYKPIVMHLHATDTKYKEFEGLAQGLLRVFEMWKLAAIYVQELM